MFGFYYEKFIMREDELISQEKIDNYNNLVAFL